MAIRRRLTTSIRNFLLIFSCILATYFVYWKSSQLLKGQPFLADRKPLRLDSAEGRCSRKNVLLIISDDLRPQLECFQGPDYPTPSTPQRMYTPNLDRLAERSLVLKRAYAQIGSCGPSRTSFLTSRRPDTTKVWDLKTYWRWSGGNFTTLPQYFKQHGYRTAGVGKVFHPEKSSNFDDPVSWTEPYYHPPNMPHWSYVFTVGVSWKAVSRREREEMPLEDEQTANETLMTLRRLAPDALSCERPFFLAAGFHKPHLPFVFPEEFLDHYRIAEVEPPSNQYIPRDMPTIAWQDFPELRRFVDMKKLKHRGSMNETYPKKVTKTLRMAYYAAVSYIDSLVGDVLFEIDELGLADSTVVAFIGDHGFHLGENAQWTKHTNFEQGVHTPIMLHVPKVTESRIDSRSLSELLDVYPTLVEAAGLPPMPKCPRNSSGIEVCTEGVSLLPLIRDPGLELREAAFSQHRRLGLQMGYTMRTDRYRYTEWVHYLRTWNANEKWDYGIHWDSPRGVELYDHRMDPEENVNRANDPKYSTVRRTLSDKLHEYFDSTIYDVKGGESPSGLREDT
ncbi:hypothetical protein LSH36_471g06066 [Paralvinella palmiformis]|uniref:Sulfatase N-terminal domain-containing protein n=1 Tax=Paralvinella palmiformis TaxID=53620 RepID=A0AAD9JAM2_9ANNE|nr:hypothetical protein LSH36_471g06066 [Paralvinella palmiformis]